jgi:hypothetical protein
MTALHEKLFGVEENAASFIIASVLWNQTEMKGVADVRKETSKSLMNWMTTACYIASGMKITWAQKTMILRRKPRIWKNI